jgi:signal peptidase I
MKTTPSKQSPASCKPEKGPSKEEKQKPPDNWRETVESIVVAFVLAFLFRTFEAEAFVIPTGSMAPTLYGQHRDVICEQCGTRFAAGVTTDAELRDGAISPNYRSKYAICANANCRYPNDVLDREMFAGDRILVNKFPYEFYNPQRWDVVVFKFPESAKTNYIKRLVGLPGEELKVSGGDIWVRKLDADGNGTGVFRIPRKIPEKQRQLQILVHDNDRPATKLLETGWPESWAPTSPEEATGWRADPKSRAFRVDPVAAGEGHEDWIRYSHYLPTEDDWDRVEHGLSPRRPPHPQWITDFYAYNSRITVGEDDARRRRDEPPNKDSKLWVGDLTLSCTVEVLGTGGEAIFELVEGERRYRCTIDLATGHGRLAYTPEMTNIQDPQPLGDEFEMGMHKPGKYGFSFANVDDRLCVWIDDRLVKALEFEEGSVKFPAPSHDLRPGEADKAPVGIGARGATLRIAHLKIERDVYYTPDPNGLQPADHDLFFTLHDDPEDDRNDEFLMFGDNSPHSNDSRGWLTTHTVARHLLIGKAFFVYWPHGVPFLNGGRGFPLMKYREMRQKGSSDPPGPPISKFSVPFYPNVGRMHRIR